MYHTTPSNGTYAGESANEPLSSEAKETRRLLARVIVIEEGWTDTLYHDLEEEATLTDYLSSSSSGYGVDSNGKGRWTALPHTPVGALQLSARLTEIISSIIAHLSVHGENEATRQAVNTHSPPPTGIDGALVRKTPASRAYLEWSNVASAFSVRPDGLPLTGAKQVSSIVDQCQEIFAHQPNRNFIRSLIITQSSARLVHCDHTGTYLTPPINIHDRPHTFIRLILGLSSANESILGFDVSIQWTIHPVSGKKGVGTIEALDEENIMTSYTLAANEPPFIQAILGRGTTCWCATHPVNGERVVIKDSWRPELLIPVDAG
ncbi:hypothetical protein DFP72DRAFT_1145823 [Ephemerocybe angulata]|uniref:Fungal-type protein kinase domain-containing protein n=1 Tax=Ephemerocybe angulata TaxID=980116 RepID=A0A8H6M194_9AGAR|nr:hypothetical protein DFP72DRAFT_1145823 [Tulosesus angulatus]